MEVYTATSLVLASFVALVTSQSMPMEVPDAPILVHSVAATSFPNFTRVSMCYSSVEPVKPSWTIDEGFTPFYFNSKTFQSKEKHLNGSITASIDLPTDLKFSVLRCHLVCEEHSYLLHLALRINHGMQNAYERVNQYSVYVPPSREIGITPLGEARFHTMVNSTGTSFVFGMLQAEVALHNSLPKDFKNTFFDSHAAYSFLPDDKNKPVRLSKVMENKNEYHANVIIKSDKMYKDGAVISILAACTNPSTMIHRMDMKQVRYVHPTGTAAPVKPDTLGFIQEDYNLFVERNQHALIRCTVIGNPQPAVTLHKKGKTGLKSAALDAPFHMTELKYKTTVVFHIFNVDETKIGKYVCIASNGNRMVESTIHSLSLITQQMIQESLK